jgi:hypothetical protein
MTASCTSTRQSAMPTLAWAGSWHGSHAHAKPVGMAPNSLFGWKSLMDGS